MSPRVSISQSEKLSIFFSFEGGGVAAEQTHLTSKKRERERNLKRKKKQAKQHTV
jgi:hypothetical protein